MSGKKRHRTVLDYEEDVSAEREAARRDRDRQPARKVRVTSTSHAGVPLGAVPKDKVHRTLKTGVSSNYPSTSGLQGLYAGSEGPVGKVKKTKRPPIVAKPRAPIVPKAPMSTPTGTSESDKEPAEGLDDTLNDPDYVDMPQETDSDENEVRDTHYIIPASQESNRKLKRQRRPRTKNSSSVGKQRIRARFWTEDELCRLFTSANYYKRELKGPYKFVGDATFLRTVARQRVTDDVNEEKPPKERRSLAEVKNKLSHYQTFAKKAHEELVMRYGYSGAGKVPEEEHLRESVLLAIEYTGIDVVVGIPGLKPAALAKKPPSAMREPNPREAILREKLLERGGASRATTSATLFPGSSRDESLLEQAQSSDEEDVNYDAYGCQLQKSDTTVPPRKTAIPQKKTYDPVDLWQCVTTSTQKQPNKQPTQRQKHPRKQVFTINNEEEEFNLRTPQHSEGYQYSFRSMGIESTPQLKNRLQAEIQNYTLESSQPPDTLPDLPDTRVSKGKSVQKNVKSNNSGETFERSEILPPRQSKYFPPSARKDQEAAQKILAQREKGITKSTLHSEVSQPTTEAYKVSTVRDRKDQNVFTELRQKLDYGGKGIKKKSPTHTIARNPFDDENTDSDAEDVTPENTAYIDDLESETIQTPTFRTLEDTPVPTRFLPERTSSTVKVPRSRDGEQVYSRREHGSNEEVSSSEEKLKDNLLKLKVQENGSKKLAPLTTQQEVHHGHNDNFQEGDIEHHGVSDNDSLHGQASLNSDEAQENELVPESVGKITEHMAVGESEVHVTNAKYLTQIRAELQEVRKLHGNMTEALHTNHAALMTVLNKMTNVQANSCAVLKMALHEFAEYKHHNISTQTILTKNNVPYPMVNEESDEILIDNGNFIISEYVVTASQMERSVGEAAGTTDTAGTIGRSSANPESAQHAEDHEMSNQVKDQNRSSSQRVSTEHDDVEYIIHGQVDRPTLQDDHEQGVSAGKDQKVSSTQRATSKLATHESNTPTQVHPTTLPYDHEEGTSAGKDKKVSSTQRATSRHPTHESNTPTPVEEPTILYYCEEGSSAGKDKQVPSNQRATSQHATHESNTHAQVHPTTLPYDHEEGTSAAKDKKVSSTQRPTSRHPTYDSNTATQVEQPTILYYHEQGGSAAKDKQVPSTQRATSQRPIEDYNTDTQVQETKILYDQGQEGSVGKEYKVCSSQPGSSYTLHTYSQSPEEYVIPSYVQHQTPQPQVGQAMLSGHWPDKSRFSVQPVTCEGIQTTRQSEPKDNVVHHHEHATSSETQTSKITRVHNVKVPSQRNVIVTAQILVPPIESKITRNPRVTSPPPGADVVVLSSPTESCDEGTRQGKKKKKKDVVVLSSPSESCDESTERGRKKKKRDEPKVDTESRCVSTRSKKEVGVKTRGKKAKPK